MVKMQILLKKQTHFNRLFFFLQIAAIWKTNEEKKKTPKRMRYNKL